MVKDGFSDLQDAVQSATQRGNREENIDRLQIAFKQFSRETERLEMAYRSLEKKFKDVNVELQRKVEELDSVSNYLENTLSNISQGILFISPSGIILTCNLAAEKILSKDKDSVLFNHHKAGFEEGFFGFDLNQALEEERVPEISFITIVHKGGLDQQIEVTSKFVYKGAASHRGIIILLRDVTEVRRLEYLMSRNDRMKELGEMAAQVAHEIRNPLGGIEGYAALLYRDLEGDTKKQEMASQIVNGTRAVNHLITRLLQYSRPYNMCCECIDLVKHVRSVINFLSVDDLFRDRVNLALKSDMESLNFSFDADMIKGAMLNLCINAAQAISGKGDIVLGIYQPENYVQLSVRDSGEGIPLEIIEHIFSPFFTTKHDGSGFGLSEVYKVTQAHGGTIDVESKIGEGSLFTINLPLTIT